MTLKAQMAQDVAAVFLNTDDFGENATYYPEGDVVGFACIVVMGQSRQVFVGGHGGVNDQQRGEVFANLAVIQAGTLTRTGTARNPHRNDSLVFTDAATTYPGTWVVQTASTDDGGGVTMQVQREIISSDGGDVQRVDG